MEKLQTNQSVKNLRAYTYNSLVVNFDALNSLQFFDALGIEKFQAPFMVIILKKPKTRRD